MIRWMLRRCVALCLALPLFVAGCATVPETERQQLLLLSPAAETDLGVDAFEQIREELDLIEEGPERELVERVGHRIVAVAEPMLADRGFQDLDWEFHAADSEEINAFVLPGGKVVFYTGLLDLAENEAQVAAVMGHEVAHVVGRHAGERLSQNVLLDVSLTAAHAALAGGDPARRDAVLAALGAGATVGVQLPFSRAHEREADEIGLFLMARAGYDPREAVSFWERMGEQPGERPPEFLSTHPAPERRVADLEALMPRALEEYRAAGGTAD